MQIQSKGKGKLGGARVIVYDILAAINKKRIIFVSIYDKSETASLSDAKIISLIKEI